MEVGAIHLDDLHQGGIDVEHALGIGSLAVRLKPLRGCLDRRTAAIEGGRKRPSLHETVFMHLYGA